MFSIIGGTSYSDSSIRISGCILLLPVVRAMHHSLLNPYPDVLSALTALPVELGATPVTPTTKGTKYKDYSGLAIIQPLENSGLACR